jgi:hypothetical protein
MCTHNQTSRVGGIKGDVEEDGSKEGELLLDLEKNEIFGKGQDGVIGRFAKRLCIVDDAKETSPRGKLISLIIDATPIHNTGALNVRVDQSRPYRAGGRTLTPCDGKEG